MLGVTQAETEELVEEESLILSLLVLRVERVCGQLAVFNFRNAGDKPS